MVKLSIISPIYKGEKLLSKLVEEIEQAALQITPYYEIILVEDNSPDNSWTIIKDIAAKNSKVIGIRFSRNFGQQEALHAGFKYATGEFVATLDCDLQDPPSELINMMKKTDQGYDIVLASRVNRKDDFLKRISSRAFYKVLNILSDVKVDPSVANFALYRRNALEALLSMGDYFVYYPFMVNWIGFKKCVHPFKHQEREDNIRSSYTYKKRLRIAFLTIVSYSDRPLKIVLKLGIAITFFSSLLALLLVILYFTKKHNVQGWMSLFVSVWFLGGIIISTLGMIGIYVGNTFEKVKSRPNYIISEIAKS